MANKSLGGYGTLVPTAQTEKLCGRDQIQNAAGGFVFEVDKWTQLNRWLILGSTGGSYYASEKKLTFQNLDAVQACIDEDGLRTVSIIVEISDAGRAPKNDQALFALAMASATGNEAARKAAYVALPKVARTATHLFQFISYREQFARWSAGLRRAVGRWYTEKDPGKLALQLVKYRNREGWTHRDVLRKAHVGANGHAAIESNAHRDLIDWAVHRTKTGLKKDDVLEPENGHMRLIKGFEKVQKADTPEKVIKAIRNYGLPWEAVPPQFVNDVEVRYELLKGMPVGALVRQLGLLTDLGVLAPLSAGLDIALRRLRDPEAVKFSRIHPISVLLALKTYESGRGERRTWRPLPQIVDALDDCFYLAFGNVEGTGKRRMIALDVSGSMSGSKTSGGFFGNFPDVPGFPGLSPREAAAAMAMVSMKTGDPYEIVAFTSQRSTSQRRQYSHYRDVPEVFPGLSSLSYSPRQRLDDICKDTESMFPGGTDCSLPMRYAAQMRREVDVFEIYTDSDTWQGEIHASQALQGYRKAMGINAKLVVVAMTATNYSIADPRDAGMLDVAGFDAATPNIISAFADGEL